MPDSADDNPSDPRRRIRRHRYQEGPGFLFLATQNGRPRLDAARPNLDQVRRRMRAVRLAAEQGVETACQELATSVAGQTSSGTSTSRARSSSTWEATTSRPGSWA